MENKIDDSQDRCIWKPPIKKTIDGVPKLMSFPCRYPQKEKIFEVCNPCLLGDVFAMQFTQMSNLRRQSDMSEEIMTFLKTMTDDGSFDNLK